MSRTICDDCNDEGWVWDDEEGGSYDCACLGDPAVQLLRFHRQRFHSEAHSEPESWSDCERCIAMYESADKQRFHDERHEPGHPLPMRWEDCRRCADLDRVLA